MQNDQAKYLLNEHVELTRTFYYLACGYKQGKDELAALLDQIKQLEQQYEFEREQERADKREVIRLYREMSGAEK